MGETAENKGAFVPEQKPVQDTDVDALIALLDGCTRAGESRIKVNVSEGQQEGTVSTQYHHGRCDVGSPWAQGTVRNFGC